MASTCSTNEGRRNTSRLLVGKPEGKRLLGRPKRRWMDNMKIDLRVIVWGNMDWIDLAQERDQRRAFVNTVMNLYVPCNVGKFLSSCTAASFSRRAQLHKVSHVSFVPLRANSKPVQVPPTVIINLHLSYSACFVSECMFQQH
jgi:hypothetical protein